MVSELHGYLVGTIFHTLHFAVRLFVANFFLSPRHRNKTDTLRDDLANTFTLTQFTTSNDPSGINQQLKRVAQLIALRNQRGQGINRDVFYVEMGGFDAHSDVLNNLETRLPSLNTAIANFW